MLKEIVEIIRFSRRKPYRLESFPNILRIYLAFESIPTQNAKSLAKNMTFIMFKREFTI